MILFRRPSSAAIQQFRQIQAGLGLTYSAVGATAGTPPPGYVVDRIRVRLGEGEKDFHTARAALLRWEQFRLGWVEAVPPDTPIREGEVIAILARILGMWWLNACRIVDVVDRTGPVSAFGLAYGTLPGHAAQGEERFLVEWDRQEGGVWYDLLAFSRPRRILAWLGYPWVRRVQKRFRQDSAAAMQRAVRGGVKN